MRKLLKATQRSILSDPEFDIRDWTHCIASHVCRAAGHTVSEGKTESGEMVMIAAEKVLRMPEFVRSELFISLWPSGSVKDRVFACELIDDFIEKHAQGPKESPMELELIS